VISTMSWVDRINAGIVRRISRGRARVSAEADGITTDEQGLSYADLERTVAFCQASVVGDDLSLVLDFGQGRLVTVTERDAVWKEVVDALGAHPRSRTRYADWSVGLVADVKARFELLWPREAPVDGEPGTA